MNNLCCYNTEHNIDVNIRLTTVDKIDKDILKALAFVLNDDSITEEIVRWTLDNYIQDTPKFIRNLNYETKSLIHASYVKLGYTHLLVNGNLNFVGILKSDVARKIMLQIPEILLIAFSRCYNISIEIDNKLVIDVDSNMVYNLKFNGFSFDVNKLVKNVLSI
jgi:hypothetical protein